jgi:glycosyltransferase involved in cell wall biosynthesis
MTSEKDHRRNIVVAATSDLATDQRVQRSARALQEHGMEVTLFGRKLTSSLELVIPGIRVVRKSLIFTKGPIFYASFNLRLFIFLLFHKCDLILSNDLDTLLACRIAAKIKRCKVIYDSHEYFTGVPEVRDRKIVQKAWKFIERLCLPGCDLVYTVNDSIAGLYMKEYDRFVGVVRNVPDVMPNKFSGTDKIAIRKELGLPVNSNLIILQGAGINMERGAEEAISAMHHTEGVTLLIVGGGDVMEELIEKVHREGLDNKVKFIPKQPYEKLLQYTAATDLGITFDKDTNINYRFSLPNKLFDYIITRVPVLASDLPEIRKVINHYDIGMFIESHDPAHIAGMMMAVFEDRGRYYKWKQNLDKAAEELNWPQEKKVMLKLIDEYAGT